jgi:hypothetical protein
MSRCFVYSLVVLSLAISFTTLSFSQAPYITNGTTPQPGASFNISGSGTAATFNATSQFFLNGVPVLGSIGNTGLFLGPGSGQSNAGAENTFLGVSAGQANSTGSYLTFVGTGSGLSNTAGNYNSFLGRNAGAANTTGSYNSFLGMGAGRNNTTGSFLTFLGMQAGLANTTGGENTFVGTYSGFSNTIGSFSSFLGTQAGYSNTTGSYNSFLGYNAGYANTTGSYNSFIGMGAGRNNTTGGYLTFLGMQSGFANTTGYDNTFTGTYAGYSNTTGNLNTFTGTYSGYANTTGSSNTFVGYDTGQQNSSGNLNLHIGSFSGFYNQNGSNNIYIASWGCNSTSNCNESNTIRIGNNYGSQPITASYIGGIYGVGASGGIPVFINSNGQLGTSPSSRRFKEQISDMGGSSSALMKLRPVTFLYKPEYDKGPRTLQYGLIAEEVAEVYPDLVAYDADGKPYTVKYQHLAPMLLNELQKQHAIVSAQQDQIKALQAQNGELRERLSRIEALLTQSVK